MGTNYYWHEDQCEHCRRTSKPIHIGKSSFGWAFSLHVGKNEWDDAPRSFEDWLVQFQKPGSVILDEYDRVVPVQDMIRTITEREDYKCNDGCLRHHSEDKKHCLKAFYDKSYDYCIGEYS